MRIGMCLTKQLSYRLGFNHLVTVPESQCYSIQKRTFACVVLADYSMDEVEIERQLIADTDSDWYRI
jgi:hypothetical protein